MGWLRQLMGGEPKDGWRRFARELNCRYVAGGLVRDDRILIRVEPWTVRLDTYQSIPGGGKLVGPAMVMDFTRLRARFVRRNDFRFEAHAASPIEPRESLDLEHIDTGYPELDRDLVFRATGADLLHTLFADARLRERLTADLPERFAIDPQEGLLRQHLPAGVHQLFYSTPGEVSDPARLRGFVELLHHSLRRLVEIGVAADEPPDVTPS